MSATPDNPSAQDGTEQDPSPVAAANTEADVMADDVTDPYVDQIDRSVIIAQWLQSFAMWALRLLIIAVAAYAGWFLLRQFWQGILPIILAIIVCTVLAPPTTWLRRHKVPGALAALLTLAGTIAIFSAILAFIAPDIARQTQTLYLQAVVGIQELQLSLQGPPFNLNGDDLDEIVNEAATWLQEQAGTIAGGIFSGIGAATSILVTLGVMLVLTFFFLKDGHRFLPWVRSVSGRRAGWQFTEVLSRGWNTLGGFIRAQAIVSAVDAIFIGLGLVLIGVPMAMALAVITFFAGFIPIVGAISAGALAVLIALVSLGVTEAVLTLILIVSVQQLEGNILSPILQSRAMNLHPVIVLVSVTVGGGLFGIIGAFLAVPVAAMIAVLFRYLQDMMALQSGEKTAEQIGFATEEGRYGAAYTEEKGRRMREELHASIIHVDESTPVPEDRLRMNNSTLERMFEIIRRR